MLVTCLFDLKGTYLDWTFGVSLDEGKTMLFAPCGINSPFVVDQVKGGSIWFITWFNNCSDTKLDPHMYLIGKGVVPDNLASPYITLSDKDPSNPFSNHTCIVTANNKNTPNPSSFYVVNWKDQAPACINDVITGIQYVNIQKQESLFTFMLGKDGVLRLDDKDTSAPLFTFNQLWSSSNAVMSLQNIEPEIQLYVDYIEQAQYTLNDIGHFKDQTPCNACQISRIENSPISTNGLQKIVEFLAAGIVESNDYSNYQGGTLTLTDANNKVIVSTPLVPPISSTVPQVDKIKPLFVTIGVQMDLKGTYLRERGFEYFNGWTHDSIPLNCSSSVVYITACYDDPVIQFWSSLVDCNDSIYVSADRQVIMSVPIPKFNPSKNPPILVLKDKTPTCPFSDMTCFSADNISFDKYFKTEWMIANTSPPCSGPIATPISIQVGYGQNSSTIPVSFNPFKNVITLSNTLPTSTGSSLDDLYKPPQRPYAYVKQAEFSSKYNPPYVYSVTQGLAYLFLSGCTSIVMEGDCNECNIQRLYSVPLDNTVITQIIDQLAEFITKEEYITQGTLVLVDPKTNLTYTQSIIGLPTLPIREYETRQLQQNLIRY